MPAGEQRIDHHVEVCRDRLACPTRPTPRDGRQVAKRLLDTTLDASR
jgi:hypothetical protein